MIQLLSSAQRQLASLLEKRRALIAVHRGIGCADIVENTIDGLRLGWRSGGDIAELDVVMSSDGRYYVLHDEMELRLLGESGNLGNLHSSEIERKVYYNMCRQPAGRVNRLEELLEGLRGGGWINVDRSWRYWNRDLLDLLAGLDLYDQLILKAPAGDKDALDGLERSGKPFLFMPILGSRADWSKVRDRDLAMVGVEILFDREDHELLAPDFMEELRGRGLFVWANAICMGRDYFNITAHHDDRGAVLEDPDAHWGWLLDHGCNVLQTDFPSLLYVYLQERYPGSRPSLCQRLRAPATPAR